MRTYILFILSAPTSYVPENILLVLTKYENLIWESRSLIFPTTVGTTAHTYYPIPKSVPIIKVIKCRKRTVIKSKVYARMIFMYVRMYVHIQT